MLGQFGLLLVVLSLHVQTTLTQPENFALLASTLFTFQEHVCQNNYLDVRCPKGTIINVVFAQYGRQVPTSEMCPARSKLSDFYSTKAEDTNCLAASSLQVVLNECDERRHCFIHATATTFGPPDPCPGTSKYLEIAYKCSPNEFSSKVICEGQHLVLRCQKSKRLVIYDAKFGRLRHGTSECPNSRGGDKGMECQSPHALEEVMRRCHGRRHCTVSADSQSLGNTCRPGTSKYLVVIYTCVPKRILKTVNFSSLFTKPKSTTTVLPTPLIKIDTPKKTGKPPYPPSDSGIKNDQKEYPRTSQTNQPALRGTPETKFFTSTRAQGPATPTNKPSDTTTCPNNTEGIVISEVKERDHIGFFVDWVNTKNFIAKNKEKFILYLVVSILVGIIFVQLAIIVRLTWTRHRKYKQAKLDISEPVPNHRLSPPRELTFDLYSNYDSLEEPVRFNGRSPLRDEPGTRSLNNYYG